MEKFINLLKPRSKFRLLTDIPAPHNSQTNLQRQHGV